MNEYRLLTSLLVVVVGSIASASTDDIRFVAPDGNGDGSYESPGNLNDIPSWAAARSTGSLRILFLDGEYSAPLILEDIKFAGKSLSLEGATPTGATFLSTGHPSGTVNFIRCQDVLDFKKNFHTPLCFGNTFNK